MFGHNASLRNVVLCYKDTHPLPIDCFLSSLRYITMFGRASGRISHLPLVITVSFLPKLCSDFKQNNQYLDTISAWEI